MKLMTLNTHSLQETDYEHKLSVFVRLILRETPDVIALQEVCQTIPAAAAENAHYTGFLAVPGIDTALKQDNHALRIAQALQAAGVRCSWTYLPVKIGYERYDEGLAVFSLYGQLSAIDVCVVSRTRDYRNWRTRKALCVQAENLPEWFCCAHMGWWEDESEPFLSQWEALNRYLDPIRRRNRVWMLGDFNAPAAIRSQSYDLISASGWHDTYLMANQKDEGITVPGIIDGWRTTPERPGGMRIDHIWCSEAIPIRSSRTVFSGRYEPVISDHFGILVETGGIQ